MADKDLIFSVGADNSEFIAKFGEIAKSATIAGGIILALKTAGEAVKYLTDKAAEDEKAFALLANTVKNAKGGTQEMVDTMTKLADKFGVLTGEGPDKVADAFKAMTLATGDSRVALESMDAAMGLSISRGMSLEAASMLVSRAYERGGSVIAKYLPELRNVGSGMEAIRAITEKTKGSLETYTDTFEGAKKQSSALFEEIASGIGQTLTPTFKDFLNTWVNPTLKSILEIVNQMKPISQIWTSDMKALQSTIDDNMIVFRDLDQYFNTAAMNYGTMQANFKTKTVTEQEIIRDQYEKTAAKINENIAAINMLRELENTKGVGAAPELASETFSEEETASLNQSALDMETKMTEQLQGEQDKRVDSVSKSLNKIKGLTTSHTKELFELGKAATISSIMLDTYRAIMRTMAEVPPPFNMIESAAIGAMGLMELGNASSVQFNAAGAASGVLDWRAPSNTEHMVTTIGQGESILNADQTKMLMGGVNNTNSNMALHVNINSNGLDNAREVTRTQILPAIKDFLNQERGGNLVDATGNPNF